MALVEMPSGDPVYSACCHAPMNLVAVDVAGSGPLPIQIPDVDFFGLECTDCGQLCKRARQGEHQCKES